MLFVFDVKRIQRSLNKKLFFVIKFKSMYYFKASFYLPANIGGGLGIHLDHYQTRKQEKTANIDKIQFLRYIWTK